MWRNFGIIIAWFLFFVTLTMIGMEMQRPNKGGSSVTVFLRGQAPKGVDDALKNRTSPGDEEAGDQTNRSAQNTENEPDASENQVEGIAQNTAIFTWQNVNYDIPVKGGQKRLLDDVQGYVKPGRLTALMGASGAG
jgi:ATP-binding cassette subfamily G (WHITE) protein 2 (SNQ2)